MSAQLVIDDNAGHRARQRCEFGRNSWLLAGSDNGSENAPAVYGLFGTAMQSDKHPKGCLRHGVDLLAEDRGNSGDELLPGRLTLLSVTSEPQAA